MRRFLVLLGMMDVCAVYIAETMSEGKQLQARAAVIRVFPYFVALPSSGPQSPRHSIDSYTKALGSLCDELRRREIPAAIIGDAAQVANMTEGACNSLVPRVPRKWSTVHSGTLPGAHLAEGVTADCQRRYGYPLQCEASRTYARGVYQELARIWLSKLPLLCEAAMEHPEELSLMVDARTMVEWVYDYTDPRVAPTEPIPKPEVGVITHLEIALQTARTLPDGTIGAPSYEPEPSDDAGRRLVQRTFHPEVSAKQLPPQFKGARFADGNRWFYRKEGCNDTQHNVCARFLAVRGRDCPALMTAYLKAVQDARHGRSPDSACASCYDEESIFATMPRQLWHMPYSLATESIIRAKQLASKHSLNVTVLLHQTKNLFRGFHGLDPFLNASCDGDS